ncbi:MAG TPA: tripartite tricarboxylate transporter substrate binding protein [Ramlibacter sp.]|nr:tripartite tricarboxylate transporter substrate binding protein [Ramlibacter sp.]
MKTIDSLRRRRLLASGVAAATLAPFAGAAVAQQAWPSRPIRLISPYPAGGSNDLTARMFAPRIGASIGGTVFVENVAGANGTIGSLRVARAEPDGHTLIVSSVVSHAVLAAPPSSLPYDALNDFAHIGLFGTFPNLLVVNASVKARTVQELIAEAKAKPGSLTFGSGGSGSTQHLSGELFKLRTGVDMLHVPYKGGGPALMDVVAGVLSLQFENLVTAIPHVKSGRLRALAVTSGRRHAALPDIPTMQEAGVREYDISSWTGISAPPKTPEAIVNAIAKGVSDAWADPAVSAQLADAYLQAPEARTPAQYRDFISNNIKLWETVLKASGTKLTP